MPAVARVERFGDALHESVPTNSNGPGGASPAECAGTGNHNGNHNGNHD